MEQLVITFGVGIAVSFGVVMYAMILRAAIMSSRSRSRPAAVDPATRLQPLPSFDDWDLAHAVRGYDSPELCRDDTAARQQRVHERHLN
jgi:hypothetical protein